MSNLLDCNHLFVTQVVDHEALFRYYDVEGKEIACRKEDPELDNSFTDSFFDV